VPTAKALPMAEMRAEIGRAAISAAVSSWIEPMTLDAA
jgi:hypothetical protein